VTIYNPSYFNTSGTGLTQTQANALYLQKTVSDTATALESFTGGVAVNTIQPTSATGDMSIYPAQTGGNLYIGVNSTSSSGRTGTVHIADGNSMPSGANVHINNGTTNQSNTNIMNGATTSGTCNIMTGATTTGTVNICTGISTGQSSTVHISDGTTTGNVTIGNTNNAVTLWNTVTNLSYTTTPTYGSSQIGYRIIKLNNASATTGASTANSTVNLTSFTLEAGVWMFECNMLIGVAPLAAFEWYISATSATSDTSRTCGALTTTASIQTRMSGVIVNSTSSSWYLNCKSSGNSTPLTNIYLYVTRMA
jgi:hypothetical protein